MRVRCSRFTCCKPAVFAPLSSILTRLGLPLFVMAFLKKRRAAVLSPGGGEEKIDHVALLIDRAIIACPLAFDFDVGLVHSPASTDAFLLSPEGRAQLWGIV